MPYPIPSSVLKIIFIVRKMTLELKSKTTNPKSGKVNEISQRYSVDIYFIISFLFVSTCVWSAHMYLGVCVYVQARGKTTDCHSCALFVVVVVTMYLFKRWVSHLPAIVK